ncbi:MAG TPA: hypothetical protein VE868_11200, partial [Balneolaceae bacterium]|nr:hypothetical protein [Balneolaceae bacterium]
RVSLSCTIMQEKTASYFTYPPNLHELDLATLVSMYRERGIPKKARPGEYFGCALTQKMIKKGKWWFGRYYSQQAWDQLLTKGSEGYPLTEVEMNILGLAMVAEGEPPTRDYLEQHAGTVPKLAYMIVNDLKEYGFLSVNNQDRLLITPRGEKALQGIAHRIYDKKFSADMLAINRDEIKTPPIEQASKKDSEQADLF